jgi:hypothetical protein
MRFPRRPVGASRLVVTLMLLIFSAHHAAPDAPIWTGGAAHGSGGAHDHAPSEHSDSDASSLGANPSSATELSFSSTHDHIHGHCELCFSSAFHLPVSAVAPPRPNLEETGADLQSGWLQITGDARLPDAHAPPCARNERLWD